LYKRQLGTMQMSVTNRKEDNFIPYFFLNFRKFVRIIWGFGGLVSSYLSLGDGERVAARTVVRMKTYTSFGHSAQEDGRESDNDYGLRRLLCGFKPSRIVNCVTLRAILNKKCRCLFIVRLSRCLFIARLSRSPHRLVCGVWNNSN
jgi:hypothetical protein